MPIGPKIQHQVVFQLQCIWLFSSKFWYLNTNCQLYKLHKKQILMEARVRLRTASIHLRSKTIQKVETSQPIILSCNRSSQAVVARHKLMVYIVHTGRTSALISLENLLAASRLTTRGLASVQRTFSKQRRVLIVRSPYSMVAMLWSHYGRFLLFDEYCPKIMKLLDCESTQSCKWLCCCAWMKPQILL